MEQWEDAFKSSSAVSLINSTILLYVCMLWLCLRVLGAGQITLPGNGGTFGTYIFLPFPVEVLVSFD